MGSFNATCIVSGLPIEAGDSIRFLALTKNRYYKDNEHICYVTGRWQPRTAPLRGKYDDYGSIEDIQEGLTERVFFKSFDIDVIEKGVGDNQCHDVHVRKEMSQEEWLEALWEGRVFVHDEWEHFRKSQYVTDNEEKSGIPTLIRIEEILNVANLPIVTQYGKNGLVIDELTRGFVRVREGGFKENDLLEKTLQVIIGNNYAAMITCGTGNYANEKEILIGPKPGNRISVNKLISEKEIKERPVTLAMIREDVWQILLNKKSENWGDIYTIESLKKDANEILQERLKNPNEDFWFFRNNFSENAFFNSLQGAEGVSGFYFQQALDLAMELSSSNDELKTFANDLSEIIYVQWVYSSLHGQWHPTTNSGQEGNWKEYRKFLRALLKIKGKWED